jgi:hypothetical protein
MAGLAVKTLGRRPVELLLLLAFVPVGLFRTARKWRVILRYGRMYQKRFDREVERLDRLKYPDRFRGK